MDIAIACGGTGGHIFPGLAVAEILVGRGHEVTLWLAGKDIESEALNEWSGHVETVPSRGFQGRNIFNHFQTLFTLVKVVRACRRKMKGNPPDVMLAMGSYASIGPALAAHGLKVPLILHEANVIPGRAINFLARYASRVAISFEETSYYLKRKGVDVVGMPLRADLQMAEPADRSKNPEGAFCLLVMGGSRGAHRLNDICANAVCALHGQGAALEVVHLAGIADEDAVRSRYEAAGVPHSVHAFHHDMASIYRQTDLAICRAGASTCAEASAFAIPCLLVPYPYAAKKHQQANAEAMERRGCANFIDENDLTAGWLAAYIEESIDNPDRLGRMRNAAARNQLHSNGSALADLVEEHASQ